MIRYALLRLVQAPVVLLLLASASFALTRLAPGGPFSHERAMSPETLAVLDAKYGLDAPPTTQFLRWLGGALRGDFGPLIEQPSHSVNETIARMLPVSCELGVIALAVAVLAGIALGVFAAARRSTLADHALMAGAMVGLSVPTFVIGPVLVLVVAAWLRWLPSAQWFGLSRPAYVILPAATLAIPFAARIARLMRAGMLEVLSQDFVRTARAKGLRERTVLLRHALRGGVLPVVTYLGPALADVVTGSLVVEQVFQIPGLGTEFVEAALKRDYFLVMGTVIVYGAILIATNLVADLMLGALDPRVRYE